MLADHGIMRLGFIAALGVAAPDEPLDDSLLGEDLGYTAVIEALRAGTLPRALVCASDQLALPLLDLFAAEGVRVPDDVVVTGFDGIFAGRLSTPSLTTVRQPMEAMGRTAARLLMDSSRAPSAEPAVVRLGTKLVVRASCGCAA